MALSILFLPEVSKFPKGYQCEITSNNNHHLIFKWTLYIELIQGTHDIQAKHDKELIRKFLSLDQNWECGNPRGKNPPRIVCVVFLLRQSSNLNTFHSNLQTQNKIRALVSPQSFESSSCLKYKKSSLESQSSSPSQSV